MLLYNSTCSSFYVNRIVAPTFLPITLLEVKRFLRIENNQDDELLGNLISIASEYAQWYMEKSLVKQTWQITYSDYIVNKIYLVFGPIIKVNNIKLVYNNGNEKLIDRKYYYVDLIQENVYIDLPEYFNDYRVDVIYNAGYSNVNLIPAQIKRGIIQHVAIMYKNRESENYKDLIIIKDIYSPFCKLKLVL